MIEFRVDGNPIPQGSMKVMQGRVIHSQGSALAVWRSSVGLAAKAAGATPSEAPIAIEIDFEMPRPRTVKRDYPTVPPDLDKLIRGVLDALTGIAFEDDSQVIDIIASKVYSASPGAVIRVHQKIL